MKLDILNGTCKKCGEPCHEKQAFCKKCKPKEVWKSVGFVTGMILLSSFISVICRYGGAILGGIATLIVYAPAFLAFGAASRKFKPLNPPEDEPVPAEEDVKSHQGWDSLK